MIIDLRSDTVTKPTTEMLEKMFNAQVGDDVFGDDPTVKELEKKAANMFGMEDALFCTSGTLSNQIAIKAHTRPGDEVICDQLSHIYLYEGGSIAQNSLCSVKLLNGDRGRISAEQVANAINNPEDIHLPLSRLVSLENTMNKGGGCYYDWNEIQEIKNVCETNQLGLHLDGARLFNALVETNETPQQFGETFDSISICLSKGLGCPVGSILLGKKDFIKKSRRIRKAMGGGWRQAGYLAAAGIFALDNNINRLKEDHNRAKQIGEILENLPYIQNIFPIETNIVIFELPNSILASTYVSKLAAEGILAVTFGKHLVRFVTHLDFTDTHLDYFRKTIKKFAL